jgi:hypothetical protein
MNLLLPFSNEEMQPKELLSTDHVTTVFVEYPYPGFRYYLTYLAELPAAYYSV